VSDNDRRSRGIAMLTTLLGDAFVQPIVARAESQSRGSALTRMVLDNCFGEFWSRPGLELRLRSVATMAILMTVRQWEEFKNHLRAALNIGLTPDELEELIFHCTAYLGYAATAPAMRALNEVLAERAQTPT
jgi:4-carboxymuconolactone decarboxylase